VQTASEVGVAATEMYVPGLQIVTPIKCEKEKKFLFKDEPVHAVPPERLKKPGTHLHVLVAGPVNVQAELRPQPPLLVRQLLMAVQPRPSEEGEE
jgi:hypothetical protein